MSGKELVGPVAPTVDVADQNREAWLIAATKVFIGWFEEISETVPPVRVSVGWPGGRSPKATTRGQCWSRGSADDGVNQIFIAPWQADTVTTLAVLLHELIHAVDDCKSSHKGNFIAIGKKLGFKPKWTSSDFRSEHLQERLVALAETLGDFPSAAILTGRAADMPAKQTSRQLKAECPSGSEYKVRLSRKWIDEIGPPICPCCALEMEVEEK